MPNHERERRWDKRGHGDVHGGGALGSRWCGSRSSTNDVVVAQGAAALASRVYTKDEPREREV